MLDIETIHHVSVPVADLARAKQFYGGVLGLREIARPPFDFAGAWYHAGDRQLHLIVSAESTFRAGKRLDSRDVHFALRVRSYRTSLEHLKARGYRADLPADHIMTMKESPAGTAGFPQIYLLDPDRNVIELNAERLDGS